MKRLSCFILTLWVSLYSFSALRTPADALRIAGDFVSYSPKDDSTASAVLQSKGRSYSVNGLSLSDSTSLYLAVNTAPGFVLVAADDRLPEVLGYSDSGTFDPSDIPPALRFWLNSYAEELSYSVGSPTAQRSALAAIPPLCSSKWNQSVPYNNLSPLYNETGGRCVTGCVATAMAQIMYYHRHPAQGTGTHSYLWLCEATPSLSRTLSSDFGNTAYDWDNMLDSYKSGYTSAQADAVATLMYHCGVSVDMGFGASSGAFTDKVPAALHSWFGYDANYQRIRKVMYPVDSLNAIIYAELAAKRPVLISGQNDEGGHAFVCDGTDNRGYFHINWGWGGSNDGYYLLTALNPGSSQGIGGTSKGYNQSTTFYIGLQPSANGTPKAVPQMAAEKISLGSESFNRSASFTVSITKLQNFGLTDFSGSYGIALYDEDETQLVRVLKQVDNYSLSAGYYRTTAASLSVSIPSSVPDGTYHLCAVYKNADYGWMRLLCTGDDYYRTLTLTSTRATFYPNDAEPVLALAEPISFGEGVNTDSVPVSGLPLSFSVKNTGGTFRGEISARIYKGAFSRGQYEVAPEVVLRRNETLSSALQQAFDANLLPETQYKMRLCWRADANDSWHNFEPAEYAELPFMLYDPDFHLSLTDTIRFERNDSVPRDNATLYYSLLNTGAPFDGELQLSFYAGAFSGGSSDIQTVHVGTNETLKGTFSGALEQPAGTYVVVLRYREPDGEWQDFTDRNNVNLGAVTATLVDHITTGWNPAQPDDRRAPVRIMTFGAYDLYLVATPDGKYEKVFIPHN